MSEAWLQCCCKSKLDLHGLMLTIGIALTAKQILYAPSWCAADASGTCRLYVGVLARLRLLDTHAIVKLRLWHRFACIVAAGYVEAGSAKGVAVAA